MALIFTARARRHHAAGSLWVMYHLNTQHDADVAATMMKNMP